MKKYFLMGLMAMLVTACSSSTSQEPNALSEAWSSITTDDSDLALTNESSKALQEYTSIIQQHAQEKSANKSFEIVQNCQLKSGGMTSTQLYNLLEENYDMAKKCWDGLNNYPSSDVRFFKEGTPEKAALAGFNFAKERLSKLFTEK